MPFLFLFLFFFNSTLTHAQSIPPTLHEFSITCSDGIERPYVVYVPFDVKEDAPLLVYLHGAISRKNLVKDPISYAKNSQIGSLANSSRAVLLFAFGQKGATWFDAVGTKMVLDEIAAVQHKFKTNPNKVFLSGFSDGASGTLYFATTQGDHFAGFIAMNGHLRIATKLGLSQVYVDNLNNKPLYIINTKKDELYPSESIQPIIQYLQKRSSNITYRDIEGNHQMDYLPKEQIGLTAFIKNNSKKIATTISLETNDTYSNSFDWLMIQQVAQDHKVAQWHKEPKLQLFDSRASFGIGFDSQYDGIGLKVNQLKNDSVSAAQLGVQAGDILLCIEGDTLTSLYDPYVYTAKKKAGDATNLTIIRDNNPMTLNGHFNNGFYFPLFNYKQPSGKVLAKYKNNKFIIKTSCVRTIKIDYSQLSIDYSRPIILHLNGKKQLAKPDTQQQEVIQVF